MFKFFIAAGLIATQIISPTASARCMIRIAIDFPSTYSNILVDKGYSVELRSSDDNRSFSRIKPGEYGLQMSANSVNLYKNDDNGMMVFLVASVKGIDSLPTCAAIEAKEAAE